MDDEISLHDSRSMLEVLRQLLPPTTFLRDTFFSRTKFHTTEKMDIDIVKGGRKVAISVNPAREGKAVGRLGYKTRSYEAPYFKEKKILTGQNLLTRRPGETIYQAQEGLEGVIAEMLGEDLMDLEQRFIRAEELQCAQVLQTGKCDVYEEEEDGTVILSHQVDFGMDAGNLVEVGDAWSDPTLSDPTLDLKSLLRRGARKSNLGMTDIVMGEKAADWFISHPKVKHYYDTRNLNIGAIQPEEQPDGSMIIGPFMGAQVREYPAYYVDPVTGLEMPLIDPYKVIVTTRRADFRRHYGLIVDVKEKVAAAVARYPKIFGTDDPAALFLMLQSRFLMAPHQIDAVVCARVGEEV